MTTEQLLEGILKAMHVGIFFAGMKLGKELLLLSGFSISNFGVATQSQTTGNYR